jgi:uncharacterized protein YqjF (DUF2071 family)
MPFVQWGNSNCLLFFVLFFGFDERMLHSIISKEKEMHLNDELSIASSPTIADYTAAERRWVWSQHWINLLFLHWHVSVDAVLPHVPAGLELETKDGWAWVGLVLFRLKVRPRWLPFVPGISTLNELNLRTYVRHQDKPGICFLSVHADNRWAIRLARALTPLRYCQARIRYQESEDGFDFRCDSVSVPECRLSLQLTPHNALRQTQDGTLNAWLLERYRLYSADECSRLQEAVVVHPPWLIQDAQVSITANTIGLPFGIDLSRPPDMVHFSPGVRARFGGFRQVDGLA